MPAEVVEARGLIGRIYKQRYVNNSNTPSEENAVNLRRALELYYETYLLNPQRESVAWDQRGRFSRPVHVVMVCHSRECRMNQHWLEEILAAIADKEEQWTVPLLCLGRGYKNGGLCGPGPVRRC